jgi:hypothetical protein
MLTLGSHLSQVHVYRCGVIPYVIDSKTGMLYYLLARHRDSHELGDFGGGVRRTEYALAGGLREFGEESRGIFDATYTNVNDRAGDVAILDSNMAILFVPLKNDWLERAPREFIKSLSSQSRSKKSSNEISELIWVNELEFQQLLKDGFHSDSHSNGHSFFKKRKNIMWKKIQTFINRFYDQNMIESLKLLSTKISRPIGSTLTLVDH